MLTHNSPGCCGRNLSQTMDLCSPHPSRRQQGKLCETSCDSPQKLHHLPPWRPPRLVLLRAGGKVHKGARAELMQGLLTGLLNPFLTIRIDPFLETDTCPAHQHKPHQLARALSAHEYLSTELTATTSSLKDVSISSDGTIGPFQAIQPQRMICLLPPILYILPVGQLCVQESQSVHLMGNEC